jgi:general secretion pathway protein K
MRGDRGFALVITLIVTALLVALVTEFIAEVYVDTTSKQSYVDAQKAGLMAESGVAGAMAMLQFALPKKSYTSLHDLWAKPLDLPEEQGTLRVTVEDESARLSLNHIVGANGTFIDENDPTGSYYGTALRLFRNLKLPASDLCDAIADWIDDNDIPKPGGAESTWYTARKPSCAAKNARLETFEEIALVKGFSSEVIEKIRQFVTIYGESSFAAPINVNTAPKELLMALDERITDSQAEQIIEYRKNTPFKDKSELVRVPGMERIATGLQSRITAKSTLFRITAEGQANGTKIVVEAVVSFASGVPAVLYWREY